MSFEGILIRNPFEKRPHADKLKAIRVLRNAYSREPRIVLVRNAIVNRLENAPLIVLNNLMLNELIRWQQPNLNIADTCIELTGRENEGYSKVFIGRFLPNQPPSKFSCMRAE